MAGEERPSAEFDQSAYADPPLECDVVMQGGITSGVVYPGAVLELAKRYRFRSIGGASAGAIAAAVTAAAEHGRQGGGFQTVHGLPELLKTQPGGKPLMLQLFAADKETRPLFGALVGFIRHGKWLGGANVLLCFPLFPALALVIGLLSIVFGFAKAAHPVVAVLGIVAAGLVFVIGLGAQVVRAVLAIGENDFGLGHLGPDAGTEKRPALTPWLHDRIQTAAGKEGGPLTFADLWGVPPLKPSASDAQRASRAELVEWLSRNPGDRRIDLQMMTTSVSYARPMRLPAQLQQHSERLEAGGELLFDSTELRRFFPPDVMAHLEQHGAAPSQRSAEHLAREAPDRVFRHFPVGAELPVIVATRMSLALPVVIAALPLWALDYAASPDKPRLRRVLFSDGGITSNFPVHFFDSPLPKRPTFGLKFGSFERGDRPDPDDPCHSVVDPTGVSEAARTPWADVDDLFGFVTAVKDSMQNWRDNSQSQLPGFRERIAQVKLARGEGGMNLNMDPDTIEELVRRGTCAGDHLVEIFSGDIAAEPDGTDHWNDHRFVRYRIAMALIERYLGSFDRGYCAPVPHTVPYPDRIEEGRDEAPYPFGSQALLDEAKRATEEYRRLVKRAEDHSLDDANVPRPPATLRAVPPV